MSRVPAPSDQMRATGSGRRKVALPPGRSQLDWIRNSSHFSQPRPRSVSMRELRMHRTKDDAWMSIGGKVYDVTPYAEYHPGGIDMILSAAGKNGTNLFNKYHAWVNPDFMLGRCYLGVLDVSDDNDDDDGDGSDESEQSNDTESEEHVDVRHSERSIKPNTKRPPTGRAYAQPPSGTEVSREEELSEEFDALRVAELE